MVAQRRFGPLAALLGAALAVLLLRLFQVQVLEHETWASEAAAMVRSARTVPFHRGRILDRRGRVLAMDEDVYEVELCYRDFRRGHVLGQVAHARSALEMRAVPLPEALARLEAWAEELVQLSPADLDRFARGGALRTASAEVPASADARAESHASRASDLRFYAAALLCATEAERRALRANEKDPPSALSYVALVARGRGISVDALVDELRRRAAADAGELEDLSRLLPVEPSPAPDPLAALVLRLESARRDFEDAAADALFEEACGFPPGRVSAASLERVFDVAWIARVLRWDRARAALWVRGARAEREREIEEDLLPRILARVSLARKGEQAERLLDELALLYLPASEGRPRAGDPPPSWRDLDVPCVLAEARSLFALPERPRVADIAASALPFQDPDLRVVADDLPDPWLAVGMVAEMAGCDADPARDARGIAGRLDARGFAGRLDARGIAGRLDARGFAARWRKIAEKPSGLASDAAREELRPLLSALERAFVAACDRAFEACLVARGGGDSPGGPLQLARERRDQALEHEKYLLKDLSSRPVLVAARADYALVHRIVRSAETCRGFEVRETTRRVAVGFDASGAPGAPGAPGASGASGASGAPAARLLVGSVSRPSLRRLYAQRADELRLSELRARILRSEEDEAEIAALAGRLLAADERTGGFGLEALFDPELRGRRGYVETESLESRASGRDAGRDPARGGILEAPVDGLDVELALDFALQRAAEETLAHPLLPKDDETDRAWFANPVGAIVLISPDGEILVAASEPTERGLATVPGRDGERGVARERTLQRPFLQPPGSAFKPFLAAYALDRLGLSPGRIFSCERLPDGGCGYKSMHCHKTPHGGSDLTRAIEVSCNAWFAQLGEMCTPGQLVEMADVFGFGRPTGARRVGSEDRPGLTEHSALAAAEALPEKLRDDSERMRFANGLGLIEATPMQIARATAALVTGRLTEVGFAHSIGGTPVTRASSELPISARAREIVCKAMRGVVDDPAGTAYGKGLDRASLGFSFACKTGSADIRGIEGNGERVESGQNKMMKQAWVAGWFPAEEPKAVLVVMLHDVTETSSHTAVHVAAQFLRTDAVRQFVEAARAGPSAAGGGQ